MRRKRPTVREYLIVGGLIVLLICLLFMFWGIWKKEERARLAAEQTRTRLAALEEREEALARSIADLNTKRGQEASLRETYGVAKPGEEVIIVIEPEEAEHLDALPWWRKVLGFLGF